MGSIARCDAAAADLTCSFIASLNLLKMGKMTTSLLHLRMTQKNHSTSLSSHHPLSLSGFPKGRSPRSRWCVSFIHCFFKLSLDLFMGQRVLSTPSPSGCGWVLVLANGGWMDECVEIENSISRSHRIDLFCSTRRLPATECCGSVPIDPSISGAPHGCASIIRAA
jgi:hypothetical protein